MKVQITKEVKQWLTVAEMPAVRKIIADFKEDTTTVNDIAEQAAAIILETAGIKIYEATAEIAGNRRIYNYYSDDSGHLDIWVQFTAYGDDQFVIGGAYLSDIWNHSSDNHDEIVNHMYARIFKEKH